MIKFVLAFIALILVILGIYTYTSQKSEKTVPTPANMTQKVEVQEREKVLPQTKEVKTKTSSVKNTTVKSPKVVSHERNQKMIDTEEIGKGLTLEGIENANVSEEEKELLIADMVYYESNKINENLKVMTFEEGLELIANDVKNGIIE